MGLNLRTFSLALALVTSCAASATAASLVTNGDFQTGNFSGWTVNSSSSFPWSIVNSSGNFYASTGCVGAQCIIGSMSQQAYLYQDLSTVAGTTYNVSFDYSPVGGPTNELAVFFGATEIADLINVPASITTYSYSVLATGSTTRLEFLGRQDPSFDYLDNVSVNGAVGVTPEPETLALFGTGLVGLVGVARRKLRV